MIKFRRYPGHTDGPLIQYPWYYLRIGKLHLEFHRSDENFHGLNCSTLTKGWRIINLKVANGNHGTGCSYRIIKYWRSGAWCHLDVNWNRHRVN